MDKAKRILVQKLRIYAMMSRLSEIMNKKPVSVLAIEQIPQETFKITANPIHHVYIHPQEIKINSRKKKRSNPWDDFNKHR